MGYALTAARPAAEAMCVSRALFVGGIEGYLDDPDRVQSNTRVVMHGLREGKWLIDCSTPRLGTI